jgi:hypothetical protein
VLTTLRYAKDDNNPACQLGERRKNHRQPTFVLVIVRRSSFLVGGVSIKVKLRPPVYDRRLRSEVGLELIVSGWRGPIGISVGFNASVQIKRRETQMSTYIYIEADADASPPRSKTQSGADLTNFGGSQGILCALRNPFSRHRNEYPRRGGDKDTER